MPAVINPLGGVRRKANCIWLFLQLTCNYIHSVPLAFASNCDNCVLVIFCSVSLRHCLYLFIFSSTPKAMLHIDVPCSLCTHVSDGEARFELGQLHFSSSTLYTPGFVFSQGQRVIDIYPVGRY